MPEELLEDASQLGYQAYQTRRVLERQLGLIKRAPQPPRGPRITSNSLVWDAPSDPAGVTHYSIYADDDKTVARRVPVGQTTLTDTVTGRKFYVSAFNINNKQESTKVVVDAGSTITLGPNSGTVYYVGTFAATYTPVFANGSIQEITLTNNISIAAPSDTGTSLEFFLVQDATGGRTITFAADYFGIPNDFITAANTYTWIRFVQRGDGKLACTGMLSGQSWP